MRFHKFNLPNLWSLAGFVFFLFLLLPSSDVLAQASGCDSPNRDCALEEILEDGKPHTDISGVEGSCIAASGSFLSIPNFNFICGDVARSSGNLSLSNAVSYNNGDTIKCKVSDIAGAYDCVVSKPNGTFIGYHTPLEGFGDTQIRYHNADGSIRTESSGEVGIVERTLDNSLSALGDMAGEIISGVAWIIFKISTLLLAIAGTLFNWVVVKAVFQFSSLIGASPGLLAAWSILRDIGNMLLLFGFIFAGISMILDLHSYPARKALPRLIIFAILMNFSLFVAAAVVDTSNGLSSALYSQANTDPCAEGTDLNVSGLTQEECSVNYGLAGHIMQSTGLDSAYTAQTVTGLDPTAMVGLALFTLIGAFVLFAAAIMLIIRAVVLAFLMVLAPIGFAALAIPTLEHHGREWWNRLIHQAFFAPIFLLLVFVSLKITDSFAATTTRGSLAAAVTHPEASVMGVIMVFAFVISFLILSLVAAKKFGAIGADFAVNLGAKYAFGGAAFGTNLAIGGTGAGLAALQRRTNAGGKVGQYIAARGLQPLATANFDVRRLPGMGAALKATGATVGAKPGEHGSFEDIKHQYEEFRDGKRGKELDTQFQKKRSSDSLKRELKSGQLSAASERFLAGLSADEIAADHSLAHMSDKLADKLTPDQLEALMKNDKLDSDTKKSFAEARFKSVKPSSNTYDATKKDAVRNLSNKDLDLLAKYDPEALSLLLEMENPADGNGVLSNDQIEYLSKSNALTNSQRASAKKQTKVGRIETALSNGELSKVKAYVGTLGSKAKAKLGNKALTTKEVADTFNVGDLIEIQREGKLEPKEIREILDAVTKPGHANADTIAKWINSTPGASGYWLV